MKNIISTKRAPAAIGSYSQCVCAGNFLFVSGQLPLDPHTTSLVPGGIEEQTRQSIANLQAILESADASLRDIVKTTVFLQDMQDFSAMNQIYASFFPAECPARAAVEVAKLPMGARVEIEAIAYRES